MTTIKSLTAAGPLGGDAQPLTIEFVTPVMEWSADMTGVERTIGFHVQAAAIANALATHIPSGLLHALHDQLHAVVQHGKTQEVPPDATKH